MKVLLVEDSPELARNMQDYLDREGYVTEWSTTLYDAQDKLLAFNYDCVILDLMLPDGNGLDLLHTLKKENIPCAVLILSAKDALDDKIKGLNLGADDYLTKPFHLPELNARLKAIFRRKVLNGDTTLVVNELKVDTEHHEAYVHDTLLNLTRKEYDLLLYFLTNTNRVITRQSIAEHLWGDYTDSLANFDFVYQHIKNLRKKISEAQGKDYLETVYGLGYKFVTHRP